MELRSPDRKKGREGKGNLKKKINHYLQKDFRFFLFLSRDEQGSMNIVVTEEIFRDPDLISAFTLQSCVVIIYSGLTF